MAEPIEMPFGIRTWVGPRRHVLGGGAHGRNLANTMNRPCAATMRPVFKRVTTCYYCRFHQESDGGRRREESFNPIFVPLSRTLVAVKPRASSMHRISVPQWRGESALRLNSFVLTASKRMHLTLLLIKRAVAENSRRIKVRESNFPFCRPTCKKALVCDRLSCNCKKAPFTRYNLLSNRLYNPFDNRLNEQWLFVQHGCQTGCTTGCIV